MQRPYASTVDLLLLWGIRVGLLTLLLTPLIVSPSTVYPFTVGKAVFARTVIEIVLAMWLVLLIRRPEFRPVASKLAILFGLFLLGTLISSLFGVSPQRSFWSNYQRMTGLFDLAHWFAAFVIITTIIKGSLQWRIYLSALMSVAIVLGLLGILEANDKSIGAFRWLEALDGSQLAISLGNSTYVGTFGMVTTLIALGLFADLLWRPKVSVEVADQQPRRGSRRRRRAGLPASGETGISEALPALALLYLGAAAAGAFMMVGSGSRGALFGFVVGLGVAGAAYAIWGAERRLRLLSRAGLLLLVIVLVGFLSLRGSALSGLSGVAPIFDRTVGDEAESALFSGTSRSVGTQIALEAFADEPIVGWGYENYLSVWNRYLDVGDFTGPAERLDLAHNKPAEILATTGVLGFIPYAGLWLWVIWLGIRKVRARTESQIIDLAIAAGLVAFLAHLFFLFDTSSTLLLLVIMMAFAASGETIVADRALQHMPGDRLAPASGVAGQPAPRRGGEAGQKRRAAQAEESAPRPVRWRRTWVMWGAPALIGTVLILSLLFTQLRVWRAAQAVIKPGTPEELIADLDIFPQLATIPRIEFLILSAEQVHQVEELSAREFLINAAAKEALDATEDEPENLKLRLVVVEFYRAAADAVPDQKAELLERAREHTDKALEIGPHVFEALENNVEQAFAEGDLAGIQIAVARWKEAGWETFYHQLYDARLREAIAADQ